MEASKKIKEYEDGIKKILQDINLSQDNSIKKDLYNQLLKKNDTKENYVLSYLLFLKEINDKNFKEILIKEQICISQDNYDKNFKDMIDNRRSAREKFIDFFNILKGIDISIDESKIKFMIYIYNAPYKEPNFFLQTKNEITWENEELYLNNLYLFLLENLYKRLNNAINNINENDLSIKIKTNDFSNDENNKSSILESILETSFFTGYSVGLTLFFSSIRDNFKKRFEKLELKNLEDKLLFEDFIQFIASYNFERLDAKYKDIWNEIFVPLTKKQKREKFSELVEGRAYKYINYHYDEKLNQIKISCFKKEIIIKDIDDYIFEPFCLKLTKKFNFDNIDWEKNKYLNPIYYNKKLVVSQKKNIWKKLLFEILNSQAYIDARDSLYEKKQTNYFADEKLFNDIVEKIRYILYNTDYFGGTHNNTCRIYEIGNYDKKIENKSVSLLIFYSSHIIINIHEIGGHINNKLQYFYDENKDFESSPKINEENKGKYSEYAKSRGKEAGETIEIFLFGKIIKDLTIKEALYILNVENYSQNLEKFKAGFLECKNKELKDILQNQNLVGMLKDLDIKKDEIIKKGGNDKYPLHHILRDNDYEQTYYRYGSFHPASFYENIETSDLYKYMLQQNIHNKNDIDIFVESLILKKNLKQ